MTHLWQDIPVFIKPTSRFVSIFLGKGSKLRCYSILESVLLASKINRSTLIQPVYFNHFRFLTRSGSVCPWTSSQDYREPRVKTVYMLLLIGLRSLPTSSRSLPHTPLRRWQIYSSKRYLGCMAYLGALSATGIVGL